MALSVTHTFVNPKSDSADTTITRPSNWNATHTLSGALDVANGGTGATTGVQADALDVTTAPPSGMDTPINMGLAVSAAGSALTIALKGADGNDPSATNPVLIPFRNATEITGTPTWMTITAAQSLVVSSGSRLGVTSATAFRLWVVGFNDASTFRLGV